MSYTIDGNNFSTYNMTVLSSLGALDFPGRLGEISFDWDDDNGIDPYVNESDLKWNGRDIKLMIYYNGPDLNADIQTFRQEYAGNDVTLVTSYGTHTATLKEIRLRQMLVSNLKAILIVTFWEPSVTVPSVPTAIGGSWVTLGDYDFLQDFNLYVDGVQDLTNFAYREVELTYGDLPDQFSGFTDTQKITITLNGVYSSLANLISNVNNLHAVLRTSGLKLLKYKTVEAKCYFADRAKVTTMPKGRAVFISLPLRVSELKVTGQMIYYPDTGKIYYPGTGYIIYPK